MPTDRKQQDKRLRALFNITADEYDLIFTHQQRLCAITGQPSKRLCLDHDHATGLVRGLIDWRINQALQMFQDNPDWLRRAADYLEHPPATDALGEQVYGVIGSTTKKVKHRRYGPNRTKTPQPRKERY